MASQTHSCVLPRFCPPDSSTLRCELSLSLLIVLLECPEVFWPLQYRVIRKNLFRTTMQRLVHIYRPEGYHMGRKMCPIFSWYLHRSLSSLCKHCNEAYHKKVSAGTLWSLLSACYVSTVQVLWVFLTMTLIHILTCLQKTWT